MIKKVIVCVFMLHTAVVMNAQCFFKLDSQSIDKLFEWVQNGCNRQTMDDLLSLPANQLMEQLLRNQERDAPDFRKALETFGIDSTAGKQYLLYTAMQYRNEMQQILIRLKSPGFQNKVCEGVIRFFPSDYHLSRDYEVFFTATGWKWGDAMTFDYAQKDKVYTLCDNGVPAMIFNLTLVCKLYGKTLNERMETLQSVMSHELFHAILSDYTKYAWKSWHGDSIEHNALFLMFNEGMAHYIADREKLRVEYGTNDKYRKMETSAFKTLSDSAKVIFNTSLPDSQRNNALNNGLFGNYWKKYICITGMFMCYHIEQQMGEEGLKTCIEKGPLWFIRKYNELQRSKTGLPLLPSEITKIKE